MELHGWGRYPRVAAKLLEPANIDVLEQLLGSLPDGTSLIPRGGGRAYGDSALATQVLSSRFLDSFIALDEDRATLHCGAGVSLDAILRVIIPRGLLLPVLPGTKFVSVGGAIAADIHGKNHHLDGSFSDHVNHFRLLLASGEVVECSPDNNAELFRATCGGMGLTGIILDAELKLIKVPSVFIKRESMLATNLSQCLELLDETNDRKYSVAWIDCMARSARLGRGVVYTGEHLEQEELQSGDAFRYRSRWGPSVPVSTPGFLLNRVTMAAFNGFYYFLKRKGAQLASVDYDSYFFPLDNINHWNRLYGRRGFLQYQFVLPAETGAEGLKEVLEKVSAAGQGSFLAVLKRFGAANSNLLSFPRGGYTLALDFKWQRRLFPLLDELDRLVIDRGGRHYLAKDARLSEAVFKAGYPNWEKFAAIKEQVDPTGLFASLQSSRIGLTPGASP